MIAICHAGLAGFTVAQDAHRRACIAMAATKVLVKSPTESTPLTGVIAVFARMLLGSDRPVSRS